uniref:Uncharacterized protein n=1 Tax=Anguilla anguilla TaxID=7936 RepID=A0A0E9X0B4_ANGAN
MSQSAVPKRCHLKWGGLSKRGCLFFWTISASVQPTLSEEMSFIQKKETQKDFCVVK